MDWKSVLVASAFLTFLAETTAEPSFCTRGFQIAGFYHNCWERAGAGIYNPYLDFRKVPVLTPELVEGYATFMCSKVKPGAMKCLSEKLAGCDDNENLLDVADNSGGACKGLDLNPFFKKEIIDHLTSIRTDSKCLPSEDDDDDASHACYTEAGAKLIKEGYSFVTIDKYYAVANKFFNYIWTCHIDLFKKMAVNECEDNWQIPMLLALQKTAMKSLFGMHLSNSQVEQLDLPEGNVHEHTSPKPPATEVEVTTLAPKGPGPYLLMREISSPDEAKSGDLVVELANPEDHDHVTLVKAPYFNIGAYEMISSVMDKNGQLNYSKLRRKIQQQRRDKKDLNDYLKTITNGGERAGKRGKDKKWKKGGKSRASRVPRPTNVPPS